MALGAELVNLGRTSATRKIREGKPRSLSGPRGRLGDASYRPAEIHPPWRHGLVRRAIAARFRGGTTPAASARRTSRSYDVTGGFGQERDGVTCVKLCVRPSGSSRA